MKTTTSEAGFNDILTGWSKSNRKKAIFHGGKLEWVQKDRKRWSAAFIRGNRRAPLLVTLDQVKAPTKASYCKHCKSRIRRPVGGTWAVTIRVKAGSKTALYRHELARAYLEDAQRSAEQLASRYRAFGPQVPLL
jgi:hypothetical protein